MLTGIRSLDGREFIPPDLPLAGWEEGDLFITMSHELATDIGNQLSSIAKRMGWNGKHLDQGKESSDGK